MIDTYDMDTMLFRALNTADIIDIISGGIYKSDDRPADSELEDICINTIDVTHEFTPQIGTSNVNIYTCDKENNVKGKAVWQPDKAKLSELTKAVMAKIKSTRIEGVKMYATHQTLLSEQSIHQHFTNIKVQWNIQI